MTQFFVGIYRVVASFMFLFGAYQLGLSFASDSNTANRKSGIFFMIMGIAIGLIPAFSLSSIVPTNDNFPLVNKLGTAFAELAPAIIIWGFIHFMISLTNDKLGDKHKGLFLILGGFSIAFFGNALNMILNNMVG